ncbi:hypothetical protein HMI54_012363 [Coelomomyces lativittatus]|nr:hypothetical protein HMI54_012363 [Coelomomyces lativittatus]
MFSVHVWAWPAVGYITGPTMWFTDHLSDGGIILFILAMETGSLTGPDRKTKAI